MKTKPKYYVMRKPYDGNYKPPEFLVDSPDDFGWVQWHMEATSFPRKTAFTIVKALNRETSAYTTPVHSYSVYAGLTERRVS